MRTRTHKKEAREVSVEDAAYAAGLIDGEGCITAYVGKQRVQGTLVVNNTDRRCVDWLLRTFSVGQVHKCTRRNKRWKQSFVWKVSMYSAASVLRQVRLFLKLKRVQADVLVKLSEIATPCKLSSTIQIQMATQLKDLNRRGVALQLTN